MANNMRSSIEHTELGRRKGRCTHSRTKITVKTTLETVSTVAMYGVEFTIIQRCVLSQ